jgi:hypothetical protein
MENNQVERLEEEVEDRQLEWSFIEANDALAIRFITRAVYISDELVNLRLFELPNRFVYHVTDQINTLCVLHFEPL